LDSYQAHQDLVIEYHRWRIMDQRWLHTPVGEIMLPRHSRLPLGRITNIHYCHAISKIFFLLYSLQMLSLSLTSSFIIPFSPVFRHPLPMSMLSSSDPWFTSPAGCDPFPSYNPHHYPFIVPVVLLATHLPSVLCPGTITDR